MVVTSRPTSLRAQAVGAPLLPSVCAAASLAVPLHL